ncbi:uncharacterized protein LOC104908940 [Beta vulgaris subsp. vulgaris]|uniref:uncharacterized protein LOC104908940 n=1 Tax=Beta vulgaris subsp. vulgaris TaxID=3555 RepID=UPI00053FF2D9|nr:uncharacterized protein LOC104908940 [Beta vulgaris subsp. vulgaris]
MTIFIGKNFTVYYICTSSTNEALPTNSNLLKRNIQVQETCPLCKQQKENESHLFRDCTISARIWASLGLGIRTCPIHFISIEEWVKNFLKLFWKEDGVKSSRTSEFIATLWAIWLHRNNIVFRIEVVNPLAIVDTKIILLKELDESVKIKERNSSLSPIGTKIEDRDLNSQGIHSNEDCIVLVDGAWKRCKQNHPRAGIGWSAHFNNIKIFDGNAAVISTSSLQTEAHAILRGLREAINNGINRVHIYSDNKELVQALNKRQYPFEVATLAHDIQALRNKFISCKIHKVSREVVTPAHVLATAARLGKIVS